MSSEIVTVPLDQIERMATSIARSGLFGVKTPDQAMALMLIAQAEGLHPALAARDYDIIQGRPCKKAEAMLRDFLASGGKVVWHQLDDTVAEATFSHPAGGEVRISWDMKRATTAGLANKDNWRKHPRQMLRSRTVSEGVRTVCPSATSSMYPPEEVQDFLDDERRAPVRAEVVSEPKLVSAPSPRVQEAGASSTPPSATEPQAPAPDPGPRMPTQKQLSYLHVVKTKCGWSDEALKSLMRAKFGKESTKTLTWVEWDQVKQEMERNPLVDNQTSSASEAQS